MQTNTAHAFEINSIEGKYNPKRPLTSGPLHLNSQRSEAQKPTSNPKCKLTTGEQLGCCMATD